MPAFEPESELLSAISPYVWLFALFVLSPPPPLTFAQTNIKSIRYKPRSYRLLRFLYALYMIIMLLITLYTTYRNNVFIDIVASEIQLDDITCVLSICSNVSVSVLQALMQINSLLGYRQLCNIFATVAALDQDIRAHCMPTHAPEQDGFGLRWRLMSRSGVQFLFVLISLPCVNYRLCTNSMPACDKCLTVFFDLLVQLKCVEFGVAVQMVHELLILLQQDLQRLRREIAMCERRELRYVLYADLQRNQHWLAHIWRLVSDIETYFALPLSALFLYNGLAITHTINWAYIRFRDAFNTFRIAFVAIVLLNMLMPCWLAQSCIDAYKHFGALLHNLKSTANDVALSMRLGEYSLQLMHQPLLFTCGGFFDINLKYFGAMILSITTYVVILIQFKLQAETEKQQQQLELIKEHGLV